MKKKIKIIFICVAVLAVIGAGLVILKTVLSSKGTEKVYYTANVETYENIIEISGTSMEMSKNKNGYVYGQSVRGADSEFKGWVLKKDEYITDIIKDEQENKIYS